MIGISSFSAPALGSRTGGWQSTGKTPGSSALRAGEDASGEPPSTQGSASSPGTRKLDPDQEERLTKLQARDQKVRAHEAAHQAAAGGLAAGGASFSYEQGPDGRMYAVGGEVPIKVSKGRTPQETIQTAQQVRAAALAPTDPSAADRAVAAKASQMEQDATRQVQSSAGSIPSASHQAADPRLKAYSNPASPRDAAFATVA